EEALREDRVDRLQHRVEIHGVESAGDLGLDQGERLRVQADSRRVLDRRRKGAEGAHLVGSARGGDPAQDVVNDHGHGLETAHETPTPTSRPRSRAALSWRTFSRASLRSSVARRTFAIWIDW